MAAGQDKSETSPNSRRDARRILLADPIAQFLGAHDREIARRLAQRGHTVHLVTSEGYPFAGEDEPFKRAVLYRGVGGSGSAAAKGLNYLRSLGRVLCYARRHRIDTIILYYHLLPALDGPWVRLLRLLGFRVMLCVHDVLPLGEEADPAGTRRRLYGAADSLVTFSTYARRRLLELMAPRDVEVQPLAFGLSGEAEPCPGAGSGECESRGRTQALARERVGWSGEGPVILCFGQIKCNKGLEYLLPAFADAGARHPQARLKIVGRPWRTNLAAALRQAEELGLEGRVEFRTGYVPEALVWSYMCAADVVVLPYTSVYQSAVLPLACTACAPIVATAVGSIPEVLTDGDNGYLVPPRDTEALARALQAALDDPTEARRRGCRARHAALTHYSWDTLAEGLARLVEAPRAVGEGGLIDAAEDV